MKKILSMLLAVIIGCLLGFFGALVSVFADGDLVERVITITIILLIYSILSFLWGFFIPSLSWTWGLFLGAPGVYFIIMYFVIEPNTYFLIYAITIIVLSCLSARGGSFIRNSKINKN